MTDLADLRSADLEERINRTLLAVPLGATEQHGPHLPLGTDTAIAVELSQRLARHRSDLVVAPAVAVGSSGEHAGFAGTLSIGRTALELLLVELVRSAVRFAGVVLVNGHGGNLVPLRAAVRTLTAEGRNVLGWSPTATAGDSHAGHTETSVMLALRAESVEMSRAEAGAREPLTQLYDRLRTEGVAAVSPNGVLGDPTRANRADGTRLLDTWTHSLTMAVAEHFAPVA